MIFFSFFLRKKKEIHQEFFFSILLHSFQVFQAQQISRFFKNVFQCLLVPLLCLTDITRRRWKRLALQLQKK